ncbi:HEPN domain-containing protein [Amycolatopsis sp. NPDC049252]|uniref:HEPN domain-containing protein n=1 Tax=Amycolatopsis sp. NPDC049252 TaxID=3363933 RepID=UPI00371E4965
MKLEGKAEVERRRKKSLSVISAIDGKGLDAELLSHYSRYLCVLISGYAEQSVKELAGYYCKKRSADPVHKYARGQLSLLRNIDLEKLRKLIQAFNTVWWDQLDRDFNDELQAFVSVASTRNSISHGGDTGITLATARQYFEQISVVLSKLCELFDPG